MVWLTCINRMETVIEPTCNLNLNLSLLSKINGPTPRTITAARIAALLEHVKTVIEDGIMLSAESNCAVYCLKLKYHGEIALYFHIRPGT